MSADGMIPVQLDIDHAIEQADHEEALDLGPCEWKLPESAWRDLEWPHYGRVLVAQAYELCPERRDVSEDRRHRSGNRVKPWLHGDTDARDRAAQGRIRMKDGADKAACRNGEKARRWLLGALEDVTTHTLGVRKLVSLEIYPPRWKDGPLLLKVVCACGEEQLVPGRPFVLKQSGVGRQCQQCSRREGRRLGVIG